MTSSPSTPDTVDRNLDQHDRPGHAVARLVRRYIKFCIVGFSSTAIYFGVSEGIARGLHVHMTVFWPRNIVLAIAFVVSALNGYTWNRLWTFRSTDPRRGRQLTKFVAISGIGLILSNTIVNLVLLTAIAHRLGEPRGRWAGMAIAVVIVSVWNFTMNQLWTFRRRHADT
jgi:putative flippase GtrA